MKNLFIVILLFLSMCLWTQNVPQTIDYQGRLADSNGNYLNSVVTVDFLIYDAEIDGTLLWSETQDVSTANGIFHVLLGSAVSFPTDLFDNADRWLELVVSSETLSPRTAIASVPYSLKAEDAHLLNGLSSTDLMPATTDNWVDITGDTMIGQLIVQDYVGIGTDTPSSELEVSGNAIITGDLQVDGNLNVDLANLISNILPSGMIVPFAGDAGSIPEGWLLCDGSEVSRTEYENLFNTISNNYGSGDNSTTFNLPDFRGRFLRGTDNGSGNDPNAGSRTASNPGGNTGSNIGSWQTTATGLPSTAFTAYPAGSHNHTASTSITGDHYHGGSITSTVGPHIHNIINSDGGQQLFAGPLAGIGNGPYFFPISTDGGPPLTTDSAGTHAHSLYINTDGNHSHNVSINSTGHHSHAITGGDIETRPVNIYVNYIIKY